MVVVVVVVGGCKVQKPEQLSLHDEQSRAEREAELVNWRPLLLVEMFPMLIG